MRKFSALPLALIMATAMHGPAAATTYYINHAVGSNTADGTSPSTPWKHAPGDPDATDKPKATVLVGGDTVQFAGGVRYDGSIDVLSSGAPGNPITYSGLGYGTGRAIFDGGDPITDIKPCPSAAACGDSPAWYKMSIMTFAHHETEFIKLYDDNGFLFEAQWPTPVDRFYSDEIEQFAVSPVSEKASIEAGRLKSPEIVKLLAGKVQGALLIWAFGNMVVRRDITGFDGDYVLFNPNGLIVYGDRPGRFAVLGAPRAITGAGQYALIAEHQALVWPSPTGGKVERGNGHHGFHADGRSNITISGFLFRNQTSASSGGRNEGAPISMLGKGASNIVIDNNYFQYSALWDGKGAITISDMSNVTINNNYINRIERGSGIRVGANTRNVNVTNNKFEKLGRTGIMFMGASDSNISGNIVSNMLGAHGNGISLYLNNRRINVINNRVVTSDRPMTFHGDGATTTAPGDHNFLIERNIFISNTNAQAALTSWGLNTRGVTVRNNVIIGPKGGFLTNDTDQRVAITQNYVSKILFYKVQGADWTVANNVIASNAVEYLPNNPTNDAKLCTGASVAPGVRLGGIRC